MSSQTILGVLGIQVIQLKVKTLKLQVENTRQKSRSDFAGLRFYALKPKSKEREKKNGDNQTESKEPGICEDNVGVFGA